MNSVNPRSKLKNKVVRVNIETLEDLQSSFMPFIQDCGIFYPTSKTYQMGEALLVLLTLPEPLGAFHAAGAVVWINPPRKQGKRIPGIGIQLKGKDGKKIKSIIVSKMTELNISGTSPITM